MNNTNTPPTPDYYYMKNLEQRIRKILPQSYTVELEREYNYHLLKIRNPNQKYIINLGYNNQMVFPSKFITLSTTINWKERTIEPFTADDKIWFITSQRSNNQYILPEDQTNELLKDISTLNKFMRKHEINHHFTLSTKLNNL